MTTTTVNNTNECAVLSKTGGNDDTDRDEEEDTDLREDNRDEEDESEISCMSPPPPIPSSQPPSLPTPTSTSSSSGAMPIINSSQVVIDSSDIKKALLDNMKCVENWKIEQEILMKVELNELC